MSAPISLRDRRDLPFFMVRLRAVQAIRDNISGPRRARALGLYVLLCQIANEQRGEGEHQRLVATWDELARRGALSKRMLKLLSGTLNVAGAARFETRIDPLRGSMPSLIHLDVQDGPWVGLTVTAANELAERSRATLLPGLGLLTVLLELCAEQRAALGGLRAETTRADVARRAGCSTDTLDSWVKALEGVALLDVTRRRGPDGGHLPNLWEITEPSTVSQRGSAGDQSRPTAPREGDAPVAMEPARAGAGTALAEDGNYRAGEQDPPGPRNGTALAGIGNHPPRGGELPTPQTQIDGAENGNCPPGNSASPGADPRPLNAGAGSFVEIRSIEQRPNPQTPTKIRRVGEGGERQEVRLCIELVAVLAESRGPAPGRRYAAQADAWHAAAARVLADHPLAKVLEAIAYLPCDQIVGTKVRGMPDLERHIEDLRHRAHAARAAAGARAVPDGPGGLGWPEAKAALMRAVQRHGAGGKQAALVELGERDGLLARFVERVGWGALCQSPIEKQDYAYRTSWDDLTRRALEEAAA